MPQALTLQSERKEIVGASTEIITLYLTLETD